MNNLIKKLENKASKIQCSNCRRVLEFTDNDEFKCKYGLSSIETEKPQCKYFKRHSTYITCNGIGKIRGIYKNQKHTKISYKQGKFQIS